MSKREDPGWGVWTLSASRGKSIERGPGEGGLEQERRRKSRWRGGGGL